MRHIESDIQKGCVGWFRAQWPEIAKLLFAVPNGGFRNTKEAGRMRKEGITAGVADVILLYPSGPYSSLCVEFKTEDKRSEQTDLQKEWQQLAERAGNKYVVCRNYEQFRDAVAEYLKPSITPRTSMFGRDRLRNFE